MKRKKKKKCYTNGEPLYRALRNQVRERAQQAAVPHPSRQYAGWSSHLTQRVKLEKISYSVPVGEGGDDDAEMGGFDQRERAFCSSLSPFSLCLPSLSFSVLEAQRPAMNGSHPRMGGLVPCRDESSGLGTANCQSIRRTTKHCRRAGLTSLRRSQRSGVC